MEISATVFLWKLNKLPSLRLPEAKQKSCKSVETKYKTARRKRLIDADVKK